MWLHPLGGPREEEHTASLGRLPEEKGLLGSGLPRAPSLIVRGGWGAGSTGYCWVSAVASPAARQPMSAAAPRTNQHLIASINHPAIGPKSGKHFWGVQTPDFTEVSV